MTHKEKIDWMLHWCLKNKVMLQLEGECGFGRECVGILTEGHYPDYDWEGKDENEKIWLPKDAYHKHDCVAVLGRGRKAENQLYKWLKWFDDNNYSVKTGDNEIDPELPIGLILLMGKHRYARMVKE